MLLNRFRSKTQQGRHAAKQMALWPVVELLEQRELLAATLGWTEGVNLPAPASAVSAVASGSQILPLGNASSVVQSLAAGSTAWSSAGNIGTARSAPAQASLAVNTRAAAG